MKPGTFRVPLAVGGEVTATAFPAAEARGALTLLLAHGAGAGQKHPYMVRTAQRLSARGVSVVTFDFPYTEAGRKLPDKNDVLEAALAAVFTAVRARVEGALFAGGKSMGGRIASQAAANGSIEAAGLVFLGYPLHPPGKAADRSKWRSKHLPKVRAPMLFVQGTRDVFGTPEEVGPLMPKLAAGSLLFPVEGGDHSHAVLKRGGVSQDAVFASVADTIAAWMRGVDRALPAPKSR